MVKEIKRDGRGDKEVMKRDGRGDEEGWKRR